MQASKRRARAMRAKGSRWSLPKCGRSPSAPPRQPRRSKGLSRLPPNEVSGGVRLVAETGEALTQIIEQVGQVNGLVGEIASGAEDRRLRSTKSRRGRRRWTRLPAERRDGGRGFGGRYIDVARGGPARSHALPVSRLGRNRGRSWVARRLRQAAPHVWPSRRRRRAPPRKARSLSRRAPAKAPTLSKAPALVKVRQPPLAPRRRLAAAKRSG